MKRCDVKVYLCGFVSRYVKSFFMAWLILVIFNFLWLWFCFWMLKCYFSFISPRVMHLWLSEYDHYFNCLPLRNTSLKHHWLLMMLFRKSRQNLWETRFICDSRCRHIVLCFYKYSDSNCWLQNVLYSLSFSTWNHSSFTLVFIDSTLTNVFLLSGAVIRLLFLHDM